MIVGNVHKSVATQVKEIKVKWLGRRERREENKQCRFIVEENHKKIFMMNGNKTVEQVSF